MVRAYTYASRGAPAKVLQLENDYRLPELGNDELRIRVDAVSLNPVDYKLMNFLPRYIGKRPALAASDYSGKVLESRSGHFQAGDEVFGLVHSSVKITRGLGSLAEEIVAPANACLKRLPNLDPKHSAALPLVSLTAIVLAKHGGLSKHNADPSQKRRALVCGGAGSVGLALVAILQHRGYFVAATCSAPKDKLVRSRGADITFDYKDENIRENLVKYTTEHGQFDAVLDCADAFDVWKVCGTILKREGVYVNVGMDLTQGVLPAMRRLISYFLQPTWLGGVPRTYKRPTEVVTEDTMEEFDTLVGKDVLKPHVDTEYAFEDAIKAFEHLAGGRVNGKIMIRVSTQ